MLTGNGRMGAMVFGRPYDETVVINHCKLYLPLGSREIVHDLADSMPAFKEAGLKAGKDGPAVVHRMMLEATGQQIVNTDPFHPACMLRVARAETSPQATNYVMTENFENGEVSASANRVAVRRRPTTTAAGSSRITTPIFGSVRSGHRVSGRQTDRSDDPIQQRQTLHSPLQWQSQATPYAGRSIPPPRRAASRSLVDNCSTFGV